MSAIQEGSPVWFCSSIGKSDLGESLYEYIPAGSTKKVILHIGMHKTATTYIQHRLKRNTSLLSRSNIFYPSLRKTHLSLSKATRKRSFDDWQILLDQAEKKHSNLLISAEIFSIILPFKQDGISSGHWLNNRLKQIGWELNVIAFVRDQPSYLNSRYTQLVKRLHTLSDFESYVHRVMHKATESECDMMKLFSWIFEDPEIRHTFVPYGAKLLPIAPFTSSLDPFEQLIYILNLPHSSHFKNLARVAANKQPGMIGVGLARMIGTVLKKEHPHLFRSPKIHAIVRKKVEKLVEKNNWDSQPFNAVTPSLLSEIRARYMSTNQNFVKLAWNSDYSWMDIFGDSDSKNPAYLNEQSQADIKTYANRVINQLVGAS